MWRLALAGDRGAGITAAGLTVAALAGCGATALASRCNLATDASLEDTEAKHERLTLTRLTVYPIKSCAGNELSRSVVKRLSPLPGDREFLFVDHTGTFLTQRAKEARQGNGGLGCPRMALIKAELTPGAGSRTLRLSTPGMDTVDVTPLRNRPVNGRLLCTTATPTLLSV